MEQTNAVGRRKSAVARVYIRKGEGKITVNGKDYREYFPQMHITGAVTDPLQTLEMTTAYDIVCTVHGGGFKGQAEAVRLGISRALVNIDETFKPALKAKKLMTRDPRMVERKKYGRPKARRRFQFSKR